MIFRNITSVASVLVLMFVSSGVTNATGAPNVRPERSGEAMASFDTDLNTVYRYANIYPELDSLDTVGLHSDSYDYFYMKNGDVWKSDDTPVFNKIEGLTNVKYIVSSVTTETRFALKSDGTVWSWGCGYMLGQGVSDPNACSDPAPIPNLSNITKLTAGDEHVLALKSNGTVWGWGNNLVGSVGNDTSVSQTSQGTTVPSPVQINVPGNVVSIAAGRTHSLASLSNGEVYEWGQIFHYPSGAWSLNPTPMIVASIGGASMVVADTQAAYVLKSDGTLWGWGRNLNNQLNLNGLAVPQDGEGVLYTTSPVQLGGLPLLGEIQGDNKSSMIGRSLVNDDLWIWGNGHAMPVNIPNTQGVGGYYYNHDVIVYIRPVGPQLSSISASSSPISINRGSQHQLTTTASYSDSSTQDVTLLASYTSNNPSVASVDAAGNIIGTAVGQASITVSYSGKVTTVMVTVNPVAPQSPPNLNLVNGNGAGKLNLSWSAPSNNGGSAITNYLVFRRTGTNGFTQVGNVTSTSFNDSNLTTGTTYYYYVKAVNSVGPSTPSATISKQAPGLLGNPICLLGICI